MTNFSDLAAGISRHSDAVASVNSRYDSLYDQGHASPDQDVVRQIVAELKVMVDEIKILAAGNVELRTMLDEARDMLDDMDIKLDDAELQDIDDVLGTIQDFEQWLADWAEDDDEPQLETLSARIDRLRRSRQRRDAAVDPAADDPGADPAAGDDAADAESSAADETADDGDGDVFDPASLATVEECDAAVALYEEGIAALQADIAAYEVALDMIAERRAEIEAGGATAEDVETPSPADGELPPPPAAADEQQAA